jgi:hypothetical protein
MKRPTPIAGPIRVATTIMTKGFATITLYPALNSKGSLPTASAVREDRIDRFAPSVVALFVR